MNWHHLSSLFVRHHILVGNAGTCVVSFVDSGGIRHSVDVAAKSLYEAAALAVKEFRQHEWVEELGPGAMTKLAVRVKPPATTHEVSIRQLVQWIARTAASPHDSVLKARVRQLLNAKAHLAK